MMNHEGHQPTPSRMSPAAIIAFIGLAAVALYFLLTEHTAHFLSALPFLLLLVACPLMMMFMHGGHGGDHSGHGGDQGQQSGEPR